MFSNFPNCSKFVTYEMLSSAAPKFLKIGYECIFIMNNFPFGSNLKFEIEFELKIQEEKLLLNLN
jgi:hypothetical protein